MAIFPPTRRRRAKILGVGGGLLGVLSLVICAQYFGLRCNRSPDVMVFAPDDWSELRGPTEILTLVETSQYLIRRAGSDADVEVEDWDYFLLDIEKRNLELVDPTLWEEEPEVKSDCAQILPINLRLGRSQVDVSAMYRRLHSLQKAGPRLIKTKLAPSTRRRALRHVEMASAPQESTVPQPGLSHSDEESFASVISAKLDWQLSIGFLGTVKGSARQHYHQILSLDDFTFRGKAVRIPMVTAGPPFSPGRDYLENVCWTADERYIILIGRYTLCVLPTGLHDTGD